MTNKIETSPKMVGPDTMDAYNKRLAWVMTFRECLPQVAHIGEIEGAPKPDQVLLGALLWGELGGRKGITARISIVLGRPGLVFQIRHDGEPLFETDMGSPSGIVPCATLFFRELIAAKNAEQKLAERKLGAHVCTCAQCKRLGISVCHPPKTA